MTAKTARQWIRYYAEQAQAASYRLQAITRRIDAGTATWIDYRDAERARRRLYRCIGKVEQHAPAAFRREG